MADARGKSQALSRIAVAGNAKGRLTAALLIQLERAMRFELTTLTLARLCSTPELRPHRFGEG